MPPITSASSENAATINRLLTFILSSLEEKRRSISDARIANGNSKDRVEFVNKNAPIRSLCYLVRIEFRAIGNAP